MIVGFPGYRFTELTSAATEFVCEQLDIAQKEFGSPFAGQLIQLVRGSRRPTYALLHDSVAAGSIENLSFGGIKKHSPRSDELLAKCVRDLIEMGAAPVTAIYEDLFQRTTDSLVERDRFTEKWFCGNRVFYTPDPKHRISGVTDLLKMSLTYPGYVLMSELSVQDRTTRAVGFDALERAYLKANTLLTAAWDAEIHVITPLNTGAESEWLALFAGTEGGPGADET